MAPVRTSAKESATELAKRYGLEDLSRARGFARRYYINSLASKAYSLVYDMLPVDEEVDTLLPRYLRYGNYRRPYSLRDALPILPRRNLPSVSARMLYDRKLAEQAIERREALKRTDNILSRYYLEHDPLALLDVPEEDLDLDALEDDTLVNNDAGSSDKQDGTGSKEKAGLASGASTNENPSALPDVRYSRRPRYPRLSAEAVYRILETGI